MKSYFKKKLNLLIVFIVIPLFFNNCEKDQITPSEINQVDYVQSAKTWFNNNPNLNNFSLLGFAEIIDWKNAKYFEKENNLAVEAPIILKQNLCLTSNKFKVSVNRLIFIKNEQNEFISFIINISTSSENLSVINDLTKINYFNAPVDFTGDILIIESSSKTASINSIVNGKEIIKADNIYSKEPSISCYELVELFDVGPPRRTGIMWCYSDGGDENYYYPYHGGGGSTGSSTVSADCAIADYLNTNCSSLLAFEQDYRAKMSQDEIALFNTLSRADQLKYLLSAQLAINKTEELFLTPCEKHNGKGDAFRHAYWNALSTQKLAQEQPIC